MLTLLLLPIPPPHFFRVSHINIVHVAILGLACVAGEYRRNWTKMMQSSTTVPSEPSSQGKARIKYSDSCEYEMTLAP